MLSGTHYAASTLLSAPHYNCPSPYSTVVIGSGRQSSSCTCRFTITVIAPFARAFMLIGLLIYGIIGIFVTFRLFSSATSFTFSIALFGILFLLPLQSGLSIFLTDYWIISFEFLGSLMNCRAFLHVFLTAAMETSSSKCSSTHRSTSAFMISVDHSTF